MYPSARNRRTRNAAVVCEPSWWSENHRAANMLAQSAMQISGRDSVERHEHPPLVSHQHRIRSGEDQKEVQIDHRHEHREQRERINQPRAR